MSKKLNLQQYISLVGKHEVAKITDLDWHVVNKWSNMSRRPSTEAAWKLIKHSRGILDFNSIFEPYFNDEPTQLEMML